MRIFHNFARGIKNLIIWFPIIWKDRQWDHGFLFVMLHKKLTLMEKFFRKDGIHVDHEKDADKIKFAIKVLDRIIKDEYYINAHIPHRRKYGEPNFKWLDEEDGICRLEITHEREPVTEKEKEEEKRLFKQCVKQEDHLKKQDLKIFFGHLSKHILTWWD